MPMTADGRVVIVTGAARGLGRDFARSFAADGYRVAVADVNVEGAGETAEEIEAAGGEVLAVPVDVIDDASTLAMAAAVDARWGRIDILVNNAGLFGDHTFTPVLETDTAYWDRVLAINLRGPLSCTRAIAPVMRRRSWGRVVNISSMGAYTASGVYAISKQALNHLTWCLADELGADGITVNGVAPGSMDTESSHRQHPEPGWRTKRAAATPMQRTGRAEDIYAAMRYFVADEAEWCTGQTLMVNGGYIVHL